jgi:capsular polysaccharide biosynthesis protein
MSEQTLDFSRARQVIRRHWLIVSAVALLGLAAGGGYASLKPPKLTSSALVEIVGSISPGSSNPASTLVLVAGSARVLSLAQPNLNPPVSLQTLSSEVTIKSLASGVLQISGKGKTAHQAENMANAVAGGFVQYMKSPASRSGGLQAQVITPATSAAGEALAVSVAINGIVGLLLGAVIGSIGVLAVSRRDRRLRLRDEIADSIGIPVLASVPVGHPRDAAGWVRLLTKYDPAAVDAWRMRGVLHYLGVSYGASADIGRRTEGISVAVISLQGDPGALALGPQLAVFAASLGISTLLVIGPQQDPGATAALRAACSELEVGSRFLEVAVRDEINAREHAHAALTVVVSSVSEEALPVAGLLPTNRALLAVSAGVATADQLAQVAVNSADGGRHLVGILVADPDQADNTTGRAPQPARTADRGAPAHLTGIPTETRQWMTQTRRSR